METEPETPMEPSNWKADATAMFIWALLCYPLAKFVLYLDKYEIIGYVWLPFLFVLMVLGIVVVNGTRYIMRRKP